MQSRKLYRFLCLLFLPILVCTMACAQPGTYEKREDAYLISGEHAYGEDSHTLFLRAGDKLKVTCNSSEGTLEVTIGQEGKTPLYRSNGLENGSFVLVASEDGAYTIYVRMTSFVGQASFCEGE